MDVNRRRAVLADGRRALVEAPDRFLRKLRRGRRAVPSVVLEVLAVEKLSVGQHRAVQGYAKTERTLSGAIWHAGKLTIMPQPLCVEQKLIEAGRMPDAYRYDKTPLGAQVVEAVETDEWRREKITFIGRTKHWGQLRAFEVKTGADGHSGTTVD